MTLRVVEWRVATGGSLPGRELEALRRELRGQRLVERRHAVVVEVGRDRPVHGHLVDRRLEESAVALHLLAHVAQRVLRAPAVELVDRDEIGEVQHVDLLELRGGAELGRHHVERDVDQRGDRRVALADPRRLHDDEVEAGDLARGDHVGQRLADLAAGLAGGERAHVDVRMLDRVHPDAITQQRAPRLPPRRVDRDDREPQPVLVVEPEAAHDLVGERALPGAAGAGDAERRRLRLRRRREQHLARVRRHGPRLEARDHPRQRPRSRVVAAGDERRRVGRQVVREIGVAGRDDLVDHPLQAELLAVFRGKDPRDAVVVQLGDLGRHDDAAAAAEHLDVRRAALPQEVQHVLEELDVTTLVRRDRDAVRVFLDRAVDDLLHRPVVAEVDHLAAGRLQDAPHDVDRRVVAVEQRRGRDEADLVDRFVDERRTARIVHGALLRAAGAWPAPRMGKLTPRMPGPVPARRPYMTFT